MPIPEVVIKSLSDCFKFGIQSNKEENDINVKIEHDNPEFDHTFILRKSGS